MKRVVGLIVFGVASACVFAKLPPLSDDAKAKAAEAAAKTAWSDKVGAYQLCKVQDHLAAVYLADAKKAGKTVTPTATAACADPGPFASAPPVAKPLEAAGAHSPPGTAISPPSTKTPAAAQAPGKKP
jgi:hypothetical protein